MTNRIRRRRASSWTKLGPGMGLHQPIDGTGRLVWIPDTSTHVVTSTEAANPKQDSMGNRSRVAITRPAENRRMALQPKPVGLSSVGRAPSHGEIKPERFPGPHILAKNG